MATKRKGKKAAGDAVVNALTDIKRLLILQLTTSGVQGKDIAKAIGVSPSIVSRLVPARKVNKRTRQK